MENFTINDVREWAQKLLVMSENEKTPEELKEQKKYATLAKNPNDKMFLSKMLDALRQTNSNKRLAKRMKILIESYGTPEFFSKSDVFIMKTSTLFGCRFSNIIAPVLKKRLRMFTEKEKKEPKKDYLSIKVSDLCSQLQPLNYAQNKEELCSRIADIYRRYKFVNLEMGEYNEAELTIDVFLTVMAMPEFLNYTAGITLQAYLPDSHQFQTALLDLAKKRVAEGGAPIKIRLVKGDNLGAETTISSLHGWENPVFPTKIEVDANFMRLLDCAMLPENAAAAHVSVASHNLFTIGYAHLLSIKNDVQKYVDFEMFEGIINHFSRTLKTLGMNVTLHQPTQKNEYATNAVSYLVQQLNDNTGKDNFLNYCFDLKADSEEWNFLYAQFTLAYDMKDNVRSEPFRTQNRNLEPEPCNLEDETYSLEPEIFRKEADTDFCLRANREWAEGIRNRWKKNAKDMPYVIFVQVGEKEFLGEKKRRYMDHSQNDEVCVCELHLSNQEQMKTIVEAARNDAPEWRKAAIDERNRILHNAADNMSAARGELIGCMTAITGKTFPDADVEVSEAIDFCRFYNITMKRFAELNTIRCTPKGVILVIAQWCFPIAKTIGNVAAALAGGNTVILKPATAIFPVAYEFAKRFWAAGVPKEALQLVCNDDNESLNYLATHHVIKHIIFTGSADNAFKLHKNNPRCPLTAETGDKNVIVLTDSEDRAQAIKNIVASAFGNAGKRNSACSLLLVEKELYDDPEFAAKLKDAVAGIQTGSAWDFNNNVGAMVDNRNNKLLHAVENLEPGESWLIEPEFIDKKKYILKPCVKWGVRPESYIFRNELFAPLLAVARIENAKKGMEYSEMKTAAFGAEINADSPNYLTCFMNIDEARYPRPDKHEKEFSAFSALLDGVEKKRFDAAISSYKRNREMDFLHERDINIVTENMFRYLPLENCVLRVRHSDRLSNVLMIIAASCIAHTPITASIAADDPKYKPLHKLIGKYYRCSIVAQNEIMFIKDMEKYERIRTFSHDISDNIYNKAAELCKYISTAPPLSEGRVEMLHYLKEHKIKI